MQRPRLKNHKPSDSGPTNTLRSGVHRPAPLLWRLGRACAENRPWQQTQKRKPCCQLSVAGRHGFICKKLFNCLKYCHFKCVPGLRPSPFSACPPLLWTASPPTATGARSPHSGSRCATASRDSVTTVNPRAPLPAARGSAQVSAGQTLSFTQHLAFRFPKLQNQGFRTRICF